MIDARRELDGSLRAASLQIRLEIEEVAGMLDRATSRAEREQRLDYLAALGALMANEPAMLTLAFERYFLGGLVELEIGRHNAP